MIKPLPLLHTLWRSSALRAALGLGASGLALAGCNLMLARILQPEEFARFTLLYAICMIGINVGPIGADVILTRRAVEPGAKLHWQVLWSSMVVAIVVVVVSGLLYPLSAALLATMFVSIAAGGVRVVGVAHYRSRQRFGPALMLSSSTNAALLLAAALAVALGATSAMLPALTMSISLCATALWGSRAVMSARAGRGKPDAAFPWRDGFSAVSFIAAGMVLGALERLVTPGLLGLPALATLSVLATVAGSPFQMLHIGVGYTLVPSLRNARSRSQRQHVFLHECAVMLIVCVGAGMAVWWLNPLILKSVLAGRFTISGQLLLAAIAVGVLKVGGSLAAAAVSALGTAADLAAMSLIGWIAIGVALCGGAAGAHWGLTGLVCGVGLGWLARAGMIAWLAMPHLARASNPCDELDCDGEGESKAPA